MVEKREGLIKGEGKREKEVLKILEGGLRRIFGFEKVRRREIKEKDLFKSAEGKGREARENGVLIFDSKCEIQEHSKSVFICAYTESFISS